jgi:Abnormal spindle-like microcephaly-assoc'd, ASPM-SPD-2-Hydin
VTNEGSQSLSDISFTITGPNANDFTQTNNCPSSLAAKSSCTITMTFTPGNTGSRTATLNIFDSDPTSPQAIALSGTGTQSDPTLTPGTVNFGNEAVGVGSTPRTLTLTNGGNATLTITSIAITGANSGDFAENNNCGSTVPVNGRCKINVTFDPVKAGNRSAKITVTDSAAPPTQTVTLSGTGT